MKKNKAIMIFAALSVISAALMACARPPSTPAEASVLKSDKPRISSPASSKENIDALVSDNSAFAFDLYQQLMTEDGNIFYSPYSISLALAMTYAGARGGTEAEMADTLHFVLPQEDLHPAFNRLDMELATRGEGAEGKDDDGFRLNTVNAIWGQEDYEFLDGFLDTLAENYGAGLRVLDFINEPEPSRIIINEWVSEETEGRIEDLIRKGMIDPMTRLVLTNAIYFNAAWDSPFDEGATTEGAFHLIDGGEVNVSMMSQMDTFGYAEGDGYHSVELPYDGNELSMLILLPDSGDFGFFENGLDFGKVSEAIDNIQYREVVLTMPKFDIESSFDLNETLCDMGMPVAFSAGADFSGMNGNRNLYISDVVHKAFISLDEVGTEAAAATAVIMAETSMPMDPVTVDVDRPFLFIIRDIDTGAILFVGRVLDPSME